jgi:hypothetical protein
LVEQRTENPCVGGSIPPGATIYAFVKPLSGFFCLPFLGESPLLQNPLFRRWEFMLGSKLFCVNVKNKHSTQSTPNGLNSLLESEVFFYEQIQVGS